MQLNDDKASKQNGKSGIARLLLKFSKKNRRNIIKSTKPNLVALVSLSGSFELFSFSAVTCGAEGTPGSKIFSGKHAKRREKRVKS